MIHSAGIAAIAASGRIMETRKAVSPGRRVRAVIAKAMATIPATRPCIISPSHSRRAGEAQIKATRMKRAVDTLCLMAMAAAVDLALGKCFVQARCVHWPDEARVGFVTMGSGADSQPNVQSLRLVGL